MAATTLPADAPVSWRGHRVTARMRDALRWAEREWQKKHPGLTILLAQGSWASGALSAGTHTGAGAADVRTVMLTAKQRVDLVRSLKRAGFAAWYRPTGWDGGGGGQHIHVLDKITRGMAAGAKRQVASYAAGRSGLRSNLADKTYRAPGDPVWDFKAGKPRARDHRSGRL